jgi:GNAT acetyltransferase-like protein
LDQLPLCHGTINPALGFSCVNRSMLDNSAQPSTPAQTLMQSPQFSRALTAIGLAPLVLDNRHRTLVMQRRLAIGIPVAMISRDPMHEPDRLLEQVYLAGLENSPLILSPDRPVPALRRIGAIRVVSAASIANLDLAPPRDRRLARMHPKWRNRLRRAERSGLRIERWPFERGLHDWIFRLDRAQQIRRRYRNWPVPLTQAYARANPGQAQVFTALEGSRPIAAMLFLRHGDCATYHIGVTLARGRDLCAHNLLLWSAGCWLADQGVRSLELGMINTEDTPGLARFKLGTGANVRPLGGTWLYARPLRRVVRCLSFHG